MVAAVHLSYISEYLSDRGFDPGSYFTSLGVRACNLPQSGRIDKDTYLSLFAGLPGYLIDPYLGLHYGTALNVKALGFVTHVQQNATVIGQAVYILKEYLKHSYSVVRIKESKHSDRYQICLETGKMEPGVQRHLLDAVFAFLYREFKLIVPEPLFPELILPYRDLSPYELMLNGSCTYGHRHGFVFEPAILEALINAERTSQIEFLLPRLLLMLQDHNKDENTFGEQFRTVCLKLSSPEPPGFEQVAAQFPLSKRSIQRQLKAEGLSYRKIADEIRRELSAHLSLNPLMKTQDIAFLLGYGDASAYLHAVKRWQSDDI